MIISSWAELLVLLKLLVSLPAQVLEQLLEIILWDLGWTVGNLRGSLHKMIPSGNLNPLGWRASLCDPDLLLLLCSVMSDSCNPMGYITHQAPLSMDFPGKNTGVGCHFLLQGRRDQTYISCVSFIGSWILYHWTTWNLERSLWILKNDKPKNLSKERGDVVLYTGAEPNFPQSILNHMNVLVITLELCRLYLLSLAIIKIPEGYYE